MGTGQMLLTIGAIMLLGSIILTTNRSLNNNSQVLLNTNVGLEEVSYATSVIEEATGKAFDAQTDTNDVNSTTQLTPASQLGPEYTGDLNDFDDYNGKNFGPDPLSTGVYFAHTTVHYVSSTNLDDTSSTQTWFKRIDVSVWNKDIPDTVKMHAIVGYWYFR